jgi:hypothetical protein
MMELSLDEVDEMLNRVRPIGCPVPPKVLRQRRTTLTATWNCVSYAREVLALDLEVLNRHGRAVDPVQAIVDDLPDLLAGAWDDGGWSLGVDTSDAPDVVAADAGLLLDLHQEMVSSELGDPNVIRSLLVRMKERRSALTVQKHRLEKEIAQTKKMLLQQYAAGIASADDWLA